jgi:hypothetical protein
MCLNMHARVRGKFNDHAFSRKPDRGGTQSIPQAGLRRENDKHDIDDNYDKCLPLDGVACRNVTNVTSVTNVCFDRDGGSMPKYDK